MLWASLLGEGWYACNYIDGTYGGGVEGAAVSYKGECTLIFKMCLVNEGDKALGLLR
ncbi:hypothetical protein EMIT0324P_170080 [Pseudomonas chlororaphis]